MTNTIPQAFAEAVRRDPAAPLLTWYDDATGDRTELSGVTLDNWVSKTANLLIDGTGLGPGDTVALLLPPHWQTAALFLGAAAAGVAADLGDDAAHPVEALFTTPDRVDAATGWATADRYATGLLPLAMPLRTLPEGYADYVTEVRNHGDHYRGAPVSPADVAIGGPYELSHADAVEAARERAAELGIGAGDRVLIDTAAHPGLADWLLAPLVAGASVVLCANLDSSKLEARTATEKVTRTLH